jgi:hypothetical protein
VPQVPVLPDAQDQAVLAAYHHHLPLVPQLLRGGLAVDLAAVVGDVPPALVPDHGQVLVGGDRGGVVPGQREAELDRGGDPVSAPRLGWNSPVRTSR